MLSSTILLVCKGVIEGVYIMPCALGNTEGGETMWLCDRRCGQSTFGDVWNYIRYLVVRRRVFCRPGVGSGTKLDFLPYLPRAQKCARSTSRSALSRCRAYNKPFELDPDIVGPVAVQYTPSIGPTFDRFVIPYFLKAACWRNWEKPVTSHHPRISIIGSITCGTYTALAA